MRKLSYFLVVGLLTATILFVGCEKIAAPQPYPSPAPAPKPEGPVVTSFMNDQNHGNEGNALTSLRITTDTGKVKIRLNVKESYGHLSFIYIMKSEDNGPLVPVSVPSFTTSFGTFQGNSLIASLTVPTLSGYGDENFIIDIPVPVRTNPSAVTDVYYIWMTGAGGNFFQPDMNCALGPALITLNYTDATDTPFTTATFDVGTQSALDSSYLVAMGKAGALGPITYAESPGSSEIVFVTLDGSGKMNKTASNVYMCSPSYLHSGPMDVYPPSDGSAALPVIPGYRVTMLAPYTGSTSFDNVTATDLKFADLVSQWGSKIQVTAGGVYEFQL